MSESRRRIAEGRAFRRRDALVVIGGAGVALAAPAFAHHGAGGEGDAEMAMGAADAPVTIIEYSSMTCPHCAAFHGETLPLIKANYIDAGKVRLVFRDFPFDRQALLAAALARCAGAARFFGFVDVLFRTQKSWARAANPEEALGRIARLGGLKEDEITACLADQALLDSIMQSRLQGSQEFEIKSTPTFIINGERVVGAQPYERFEEIIERLLSQS